MNKNKSITISITIEDEDIGGSTKMGDATEIEGVTVGEVILIVVEANKGSLIKTINTVDFSIRALIEIG